MSKKDYRNYFNKNADEEVETTEVTTNEEDEEVCAACTITYPEDKVDEPEAPVVDEPAKATVTGVVTGCTKLNVRKDPSATAPVLCTLSESTEVVIDEENSTNDFYKVCTVTGAEGYCMKTYISIKE